MNQTIDCMILGPLDFQCGMSFAADPDAGQVFVLTAFNQLLSFKAGSSFKIMSSGSLIEVRGPGGDVHGYIEAVLFEGMGFDRSALESYAQEGRRRAVTFH